MKGIVTHHQEKRKRGARKLEPYPSNRFWMRMLDRMTVAAGILGPMMTLPQIFQIYYYFNAAGVSVFSWMAFGILDIPFIMYGMAHKNRTITVTYVLWCAANLSVAIGAIIYGAPHAGM